MEYELDFSGTELDGVTITMAFTLDGSVLTMEATEISDPQEKVRYLEFPDQGCSRSAAIRRGRGSL